MFSFSILNVEINQQKFSSSDNVFEIHTDMRATKIIKNYTGLQRNWGKHKNTRFYLIWECWIQISNPFLLITSSFFRYA